MDFWKKITAHFFFATFFSLYLESMKTSVRHFSNKKNHINKFENISSAFFRFSFRKKNKVDDLHMFGNILQNSEFSVYWTKRNYTLKLNEALTKLLVEIEWKEKFKGKVWTLQSAL